MSWLQLLPDEDIQLHMPVALIIVPELKRFSRKAKARFAMSSRLILLLTYLPYFLFVASLIKTAFFVFVYHSV